MSAELPDGHRIAPGPATTVAERSERAGETHSAPRAFSMPEVWVVDYGSGRLPGGHQEDYLAALEKALAERQLRVSAPFRSDRPAGGRGGIYLSELRLLWRLLRAGPRLIVCHTPEFRDFVLFATAALLVRRPKAAGIFVLRRDGAGTVGRAGLKSRLLEFLVPRLIRSGHLYPVSDSRPALTHWLRRTPGAAASLVSIPIPAAPSGKSPGRGPVIGLLGRFRLEKGARHYDSVIRTALDLFPEATVRLHLGTDLDGEAGELSSRLARDWSNERRVEVRTGHLSAEEYADQLAGTDVVVLPYDATAYREGTSGVLHDALALGCTVLATPIPWAIEQFVDHPRLVWLRGTEPAQLREGLLQAIERSGSSDTSPVIEDSFASDWTAALEAAWRRLLARDKGEEDA